METTAISVTEALEQLTFPSFFDNIERKAAYDIVMQSGSDEEREIAEKAKHKYPFDEHEEIFSFNDDDDFPIASTALSA